MFSIFFVDIIHWYLVFLDIIFKTLIIFYCYIYPWEKITLMCMYIWDFFINFSPHSIIWIWKKNGFENYPKVIIYFLSNIDLFFFVIFYVRLVICLTSKILKGKLQGFINRIHNMDNSSLEPILLNFAMDGIFSYLLFKSFFWIYLFLDFVLTSWVLCCFWNKNWITFWFCRCICVVKLNYKTIFW